MKKIIIIKYIVLFFIFNSLFAEDEESYNFYEKFTLNYFPAGYGDVLDYYKNIIDEKTVVKKIKVFDNTYFIKMPEEKDLALKKIYDDLDKYNKAIGRISSAIDIGGKIYAGEYDEAAISASIQILSELAGTESGKSLLAALGISTVTLNLAIASFVIYRESEKAVLETKNAVLLESLYYSIRFDKNLVNKNRRLGEGSPIIMNKNSEDYIFRKILYDNSFREKFKVYVVDVFQKDWPEEDIIKKSFVVDEFEKNSEISKVFDELRVYIVSLLAEINKKAMAEERQMVAKQLFMDISNRFGKANLKNYLSKYFQAMEKMPGMIKFLEEINEKMDNAIKNKNAYDINQIIRMVEYYQEYVIYYMPETGKFKQEKENLISIMKLIDEQAKQALKKISKDIIKEAKEKAKGIILQEPKYYEFYEKFEKYKPKILTAYKENNFNKKEEIKKEIEKIFSDLMKKYDEDTENFLSVLKQNEKTLNLKEREKAKENYFILKTAYQSNENIKYIRLISLIDEYWESLRFEDKIAEDSIITGDNRKFDSEKVSLDGLINIEKQLESIWLFDMSGEMKKYGLTKEKFKIEKYIGLPDMKTIPKINNNFEKIDKTVKMNFKAYANDVVYYLGKLKANIDKYLQIIISTETGEVRVNPEEVIFKMQKYSENMKKFKDETEKILPIVKNEIFEIESNIDKVKNEIKKNYLLEKINSVNDKISNLRKKITEIDENILFCENKINEIEENQVSVREDLNYLNRVSLSFENFFNFVYEKISEKYDIDLINNKYLIFKKDWDETKLKEFKDCESVNKNIFLTKEEKEKILNELKFLYGKTCVKKFDERYKMNLEKLIDGLNKYFSDAVYMEKYYFVKRTKDDKNLTFVSDEMIKNLILNLESIESFDDPERQRSFVSALNGYLMMWGMNFIKKNNIVYYSLPDFRCSIIDSPWGNTILNIIKQKTDEFNKINESHVNSLKNRIELKYSDINKYFLEKKFESVIFLEKDIDELEKSAIFREIYELYKDKFEFMRKLISDSKKLVQNKEEIIKNFYKEFINAYISKNENKILSMIEPDWMAVDGTRFDDLRNYLRNIFKMFDRIEIIQNNLNIIKEGPGIYTASYDITIRGKIFKNNLTHEEKSSVNERVKIYEDNTVKIFSTVKGTYWTIK